MMISLPGAGPDLATLARSQKRGRFTPSEASRNHGRSRWPRKARAVWSLLLGKPFGLADVSAQHQRIDITPVEEQGTAHVGLGLVEIFEVQMGA